MSLAIGRKTSRVEDRAYSLLGLFDVSMLLLYGEREVAFRRLQHSILQKDLDQSIFDHHGPHLLADSIDDLELFRKQLDDWPAADEQKRILTY